MDLITTTCTTLHQSMLQKELHRHRLSVTQTSSSTRPTCGRTTTGNGECAQVTTCIKSTLVYTDLTTHGLVACSPGLVCLSWCLTKHSSGRSTLLSSLLLPLHASGTKVLSQPLMKFGCLIPFLPTKNWKLSSILSPTTLLTLIRSGTKVLTTHISQSTVSQLLGSLIPTVTPPLVATSSEIWRAVRPWPFTSRRCRMQTTNTTSQNHSWSTICGQKSSTMASTSQSIWSRPSTTSKPNAYLFSGIEPILPFCIYLIATPANSQI